MSQVEIIQEIYIIPIEEIPKIQKIHKLKP